MGKKGSVDGRGGKKGGKGKGSKRGRGKEKEGERCVLWMQILFQQHSSLCCRQSVPHNKCSSVRTDDPLVLFCFVVLCIFFWLQRIFLLFLLICSEILICWLFPLNFCLGNIFSDMFLPFILFVLFCIIYSFIFFLKVNLVPTPGFVFLCLFRVSEATNSLFLFFFFIVLMFWTTLLFSFS